MGDDLVARLAPSIEAFCQRARDCAEGLVENELACASDCCESPIEKILYVAWALRLEQYRIWGSGCGGSAKRLFHAPGRGSIDDEEFTDLEYGVGQLDVLVAQMNVGSYRADFAIRRMQRYPMPDGKITLGPKVLIECDGHDFHDKTKEQAARDKSRDRDLQAAGYFVLRFTGSEIHRDPAACAEQIETFLEEHSAREHARRRGTK